MNEDATKERALIAINIAFSSVPITSSKQKKKLLLLFGGWWFIHLAVKCAQRTLLDLFGLVVLKIVNPCLF